MRVVNTSWCSCCAVAAATLLILTTTKPLQAAETLEGTWEGHMVAQDGRFPANAAYNWKTGKGWNFTIPAGRKWASWFVTLEIHGSFKNLTGTYATREKNTKDANKYEFDGNFAFAKKLMTWQPDRQIEGKTKLASTAIRSLTYSQEGDYEFLRGRWASQDNWNGIMEFRRDYDGTPLKDDAAVSDFLLPDTDGVHRIKRGEWHLSLNGDKDGVVSTKTVGDAAQWKFEAAPEAFPKCFRIVPAGDDGKCLVPGDEDSGAIGLADKGDSPDGEQFWRFEKVGDGVVITNVKLGGRGLFIEDEDTGQTILRSRNEAHENLWSIEAT